MNSRGIKALLPNWLRHYFSVTKRFIIDITSLPAFYRRIPNPLDALKVLQGDDYETEPIIVTLTSCYPRIKYCIPALKSLLKQNYPNYTIELNLWWDCLVPKRIQKFLDKHSNIQVYRLGEEQSKEDQALQNGWSVGESPLLKLAMTIRRHAESYIAVCDDDVIHHPYWLSALYYNMQLHKNKAVIGFTGYHVRNNRLRTLGMSSHKTEVEKETPALWVSVITGMLLPKHVQNKPDLLAHMARCMQLDKRSKYVDDVVIGSWLYVQGVPRLVVPREFIKRDAWRVPHKITLYHGQVEHRKQTGETIDDVIWPLLVDNNLMEGKV